MYAAYSFHYRFHNLGRLLKAEEAWVYEIVI